MCMDKTIMEHNAKIASYETVARQFGKMVIERDTKISGLEAQIEYLLALIKEQA
jgi:hypothetical protein